MLFIKVGLVPELGEHALPACSASAFGRASEMCLPGRLYPGAEAHAAGLVDRLVAPDEPSTQALALGARDRRQPGSAAPHDQARCSRATAATTDLGACSAASRELLRECWKTPEHKEAVSAFLAKRPPRFR